MRKGIRQIASFVETPDFQCLCEVHDFDFFLLSTKPRDGIFMRRALPFEWPEEAFEELPIKRGFLVLEVKEVKPGLLHKRVFVCTDNNGTRVIEKPPLEEMAIFQRVERGYLRDVLGWNKDFVERNIPYHETFISKLAKEKAAAEKERTETKMVLEAGTKTTACAFVEE